MRQRLRFHKPWNFRHRGSCTGTDDHVLAVQLTNSSIGESSFNGFWRDEASGSKDELRSCLAVIVQVHLVQPGYHLAFPITDTRHLNLETIVSDPKLAAPAKVGHNFCAMNDVFTG